MMQCKRILENLFFTLQAQIDRIVYETFFSVKNDLLNYRTIIMNCRTLEDYWPHWTWTAGECYFTLQSSPILLYGNGNAMA